MKIAYALLIATLSYTLEASLTLPVLRPSPPPAPLDRPEAGPGHRQTGPLQKGSLRFVVVTNFDYDFDQLMAEAPELDPGDASFIEEKAEEWMVLMRLTNEKGMDVVSKEFDAGFGKIFGGAAETSADSEGIVSNGLQIAGTLPEKCPADVFVKKYLSSYFSNTLVVVRSMEYFESLARKAGMKDGEIYVEDPEKFAFPPGDKLPLTAEERAAAAKALSEYEQKLRLIIYSPPLDGRELAWRERAWHLMKAAAEQMRQRARSQP